MPVLIVIVAAGILYWTVPDYTDREAYLQPVRETLRLAIGLPRY